MTESPGGREQGGSGVIPSKPGISRVGTQGLTKQTEAADRFPWLKSPASFRSRHGVPLGPTLFPTHRPVPPACGGIHAAPCVRRPGRWQWDVEAEAGK